MKVKKMVGILGLVVSVSVAADPIVETAELTRDGELEITGQNIIPEGVDASMVRIAGDVDPLDCFVTSNTVTCDVGDRDLYPGIAYRVVQYPANIDALPKLREMRLTQEFEVFLAEDDASTATARAAFSQRLVSGNNQYVQAGEIVPFEFECAEGMPLMGNAVMNENSAADAWRIVDYDIDDCRYKANSCFIVKAEKLVTDNSPIYLRGIMACQ